jgi:hypothetical protein
VHSPPARNKKAQPPCETDSCAYQNMVELRGIEVAT